MRCLALIGAGAWGRNLLRNFDNLSALRLVCDLQPLSLEGMETTDSFEAVLAHPEIKQVAIATPSETHFSLAKQALIAGKDVYVEKPFVLSSEEGEELVALAKAEKRILMVGHILCYHPCVKRLNTLVQEGAIGKVCYIASHRLANDRMQGKESVLWNYGPHDLSLILPLIKELPNHVEGGRPIAVKGKVDDIRNLSLTFPSGASAHLYLSAVSPYKEHRLTVVGEEGVLVFDDTLPWEEKLKWNGESVSVEEKEPLKEECRHFLECCKTRLPPLTSGEEALKGVAILEKVSHL